MTAPAIKATTFQKVAEDVWALVEAGRLERDELEARLEAEDLGWLDEKLLPTAWVPLDTYERCVELLASVVAPGGREAYMVQRGSDSAERLTSLGIYTQLEATNHNMGTRIGNLIVTLGSAIFSVGRWHYEAHEGTGFSVSVEDSAALPEVARFAIQGFVQYVGCRVAGYELSVTSARPIPDLVVIEAVRVR